MSYTELQVTSNFSFLRGASHAEELVEQAAIYGYDKIAITDRNTFAGIVRAHAAAKNKITITADISNILLYSPKKNIAKIIEEYSTLYPATNSASASGKSKGARLVSANIEMKKIIAHGNKGKTNHPVMLCIKTISPKFNDPANKITGKIHNPIETSYEIICAAERKAPKNAYFELLAHPAIIIP